MLHLEKEFCMAISTQMYEVDIADVGNVSQVDLQVSQWHPELVAVDKEANDDVMHLYRLGEADRLAS